jgi:hypothetical protein
MLYGLISFAVQCRISSIQSILRFPLRLSPISMHSPKIKPVLYGDGIARSDPSVYIIFFLLRLSWDDGHGPRRFFSFIYLGTWLRGPILTFLGMELGNPTSLYLEIHINLSKYLILNFFWLNYKKRHEIITAYEF